MNLLHFFGFNKKSKKKETLEVPLDTYKDTLWYVSGIDDNKPILKVQKLEDGYITAEFTDKDNKGKIHYQKLEQFLMCFNPYFGTEKSF